MEKEDNNLQEKMNEIIEELDDVTRRSEGLKQKIEGFINVDCGVSSKKKAYELYNKPRRKKVSLRTFYFFLSLERYTVPEVTQFLRSCINK